MWTPVRVADIRPSATTRAATGIARRCQTQARDRWIEARCRDLLPTDYAHVVFTLHHALAPLALRTKPTVYDLLMRASAETLLEVARDPQHLGAEIGFFSVLHTWNQQLQLHPHVHCVVPAGGLALDRSRWISASPRFFLPVKVLAEVFRGKFVEGLRELYVTRRLVLRGVLAPMENPRTFSELLRTTHGTDWVVYAKRPFGGAEHVRALPRPATRIVWPFPVTGCCRWKIIA